MVEKQIPDFVDSVIEDILFRMANFYIALKCINKNKYDQGFQSADSIHAINLLTSSLFTVNTMWTD